ncbi:MAG: ABC-F family ATP-binding cassette domain-containing protein [Chloroflexi bacterium]|uniref:ABC-F family ATP-binding cassette domain-containing protein n=1 Tax=Candidatus Chlorohelix allophototropha TaxID=3003348 RepID=A0A8T7LTN2_9CHLR|nr:ABC-F family ATP-binding cassette domain-containing protein [Chloroflexota bacterium]WJW67256.1 ABC-F family ATP-binding cassette domain-containing protein [Chloroflexota bacterium L227-S17]
MSVLNAYKLSKSYNIYPVFKDVTFQVNEGEKVALVGVNGAGKSTLLHIIAGQESADSGEIVTRRGFRIAYLPQEATFESEKTLYAEMLESFDSLRADQLEIASLEEQMTASTEHSGEQWEVLLERYGELTHRFEMGGGYDYEVQIEQVLTGLNFPRPMWQQAATRFSGGQKTRAALAKALLSTPDLLLLDEPTNHLDLKTLEWLENFLSSWNGTLIVISHDRYFLDRVVTRVLDLSFGVVEDYPGNYSKYLSLRADRIERRVAEYEAQQEHIAKTEDFIRRYKAGQRYRQARGRQKQLDRLARLARPKERDKLHIALQTELRSGRLVMATEELEIGYRDKQGAHSLFKAPDLEVQRAERIAIIGSNGSGKTTFLKNIMGETTPLNGLVELGTNVRVGYYAQSHEGLNFKNTVLEEILWAAPMSEGEARNYLGRFLFSGDDVFKKVSSLSGGERSRVSLAKLTLTKANFLILDEPTNHLDINAREALEELLSEYNGTILFVSHDRYFIDALATQVWAIEEGELNSYLGNYSDFQEWKARKRAELENKREQPKVVKTVTPAQNGKSSSDKEERQRLRKVTELEESIAKLEKRLNEISEELTTASSRQDLEAISRLSKEYETASAELDRLFKEWGVLAG